MIDICRHILNTVRSLNALECRLLYFSSLVQSKVHVCVQCHRTLFEIEIRLHD